MLNQGKPDYASRDFLFPRQNIFQGNKRAKFPGPGEIMLLMDHEAPDGSQMADEIRLLPVRVVA